MVSVGQQTPNCCKPCLDKAAPEELKHEDNPHLATDSPEGLSAQAAYTRAGELIKRTPAED